MRNLKEVSIDTKTINIRVLLFASLKDLFKESELSMSVLSDITIKELRDVLFQNIYNKGNKWKSLLYAVNHNYASLDTKLKEGDEVAFLPFVSGG